MRKNHLFIVLLAVFMAVFTVSVSHAANATVSESPTADDAYEIDNATPGTSKTFLGTRLRGPLATGSQTDTAGTYATDNTSSETITETQVNITTPSGWGSSTGLANGQTNQVITFTLSTDGGQDHTITPETATGFTDITLSDAGDSVTLKYINSTLGWVIIGGVGYEVDDNWGSTTVATGGTYAGDQASTTFTQSTVVVTTPATWGMSQTLNDGYINQEITFVLATDGGQDYTLSPDTKTGFTSVTMSDANDSITFRYVSDTIGWVIVGNAGATIN